MITRDLEKILRDQLFTGKALILLGARQTGKTTLLKKIVSGLDNVLWLDGGDFQTQSTFEKPGIDRFRALFSSYKVLVIDEAQHIEDVGAKLKLITDHLDVQLIATGSSAFELANKINEPLTGRKWEHHLFPMSFHEMVAYHGLFKEKALLEQRLLYGYYPEVVTHPAKEKEILKSLTDSYLYKDILQWERIHKPDKLIKLLQALAFQVGNQVSFNEIGQLIGLDSKTVEKYIQLLEKTFIIFRLNSLARNLRNELKSSKKVYFYDMGIRNALIFNFQPINLRSDIGALWENFVIAERQKAIQYSGIWCNQYFWRTHEQQEIDYIEESDGIFSAYEIKWNPMAKVNFSKTFKMAYPSHQLETITPTTFENFVLTRPI